jgi:hypothetical protein|tara:strand:+ start:380 stop:523 length:144 start_codon:yes stop_codon:yes gene_type:complete
MFLKDRPPEEAMLLILKFMGLRKEDLLGRKLIDGGPSKQSSDFIRSK